MVTQSGVSGLLDVARQTFKEATEDVHQHVTNINRKPLFCTSSLHTILADFFLEEQYEMQAETRFENGRRYFLRLSESNFDDRSLPDILINRYKKKGYIECQTLDLMKLNQRIEDSHQEVVLMSDKTIQDLIDNVRGEIPILFRVCESLAMLDMIAAFAHLASDNQYEYVKPEITDCIAIKSGRHPVREKVSREILSEWPKLTQFRFTRRGSSLMMSMQVSKNDSKSLPAAT
jgi:DNA mismatch repair protein MSH4